jgi:hypothetical protein
MKAVMPGKIDESGIIGDNYRRHHRRLDLLGDAANGRDPDRSPAIRSPGAELLVGFQGAIVRVLLQCFRDLRRLIRAKIYELCQSASSAASANPLRFFPIENERAL